MGITISQALPFSVRLITRNDFADGHLYAETLHISDRVARVLFTVK